MFCQLPLPLKYVNHGAAIYVSQVSALMHQSMIASNHQGLSISLLDIFCEERGKRRYDTIDVKQKPR